MLSSLIVFSFLFVIDPVEKSDASLPNGKCNRVSKTLYSCITANKLFILPYFIYNTVSFVLLGNYT